MYEVGDKVKNIFFDYFNNSHIAYVRRCDSFGEVAGK